jgi:hypothetical protein
VSDKYPFIPEYLTAGLEDTSVDLIDLMHGWLKVEMLECQYEMEEGSNPFLEGYMEALTNAYCMTYNLSIDRKHIEETK